MCRATPSADDAIRRPDSFSPPLSSRQRLASFFRASGFFLELLWAAGRSTAGAMASTATTTTAASTTNGGPIENKATAEHCIFCFETLLSHFDGEGSARQPAPTFANALCPLFVTWKKRSSRGGDFRLRGCIGTLEPRDLHGALTQYTLISALKDRRFPPIEAKEMPTLECTVSLLTNFESNLAWDAWDVGVHGMIIEFDDPKHGSFRGGSYSATYLPEVAHQQGWNKQECIDSLIQKAGYYGEATAEIRKSLRLTRYQSSLCSMTYAEYEAAIAGRP